MCLIQETMISMTGAFNIKIKKQLQHNLVFFVMDFTVFKKCQIEHLCTTPERSVYENIALIAMTAFDNNLVAMYKICRIKYYLHVHTHFIRNTFKV